MTRGNNDDDLDIKFIEWIISTIIKMAFGAIIAIIAIWLIYFHAITGTPNQIAMQNIQSESWYSDNANFSTLQLISNENLVMKQ